jgi:hypothetical protein
MRFIGLAITALALTGCAMTSDVMDGGNGTYLISAHASAIRGGATGANRIAYQDATEFCRSHFRNHAIVINASERDVYQSGVSGSWNQNGGSFGGGSVAAGNVNFRFRCGS